MTRLFHNSTAIALCLAVAIPHVATAGDLKLAQAAPASDTPVVIPPAADLETAVEKAVERATEAADKAEAATEKAKEEAAKPTKAAKEAAKAAADEAKAEAEKANAEAKEARDAARKADAVDKAEGKTPDAALTDKAEETKAEAERARNAAEAAKDSADAPVVIPPAAPAPKADTAQDGIKPAADAIPKAETDAAKPVAEKPVEKPAAEAKPAADANPAAETKPAAEAKPADTQPKATADKPAPTEADLARALAEKEAAAAKPEAAKPATAPQDAANPAATETATAATAVPEATAAETVTAREAAEAVAPPAAAALAETAQPVARTSTTEVTSENTRRATEDFATDLANALSGQAATTTEPGKATSGKDDKDLTDQILGAALPALAGLVVGRMMSNGGQVALNSGDRVVVTRDDGSQQLIKDDNALLLQPGSTVKTEDFADGSQRTVVTRSDGSQVVTIRDANLRVLRRTIVYPDGSTTALIDDTTAQPVVVSELPPAAKPVVVPAGQPLSEDALRAALQREVAVNRSFSLGQIRNIPEVRALVAPVDIQAITFDTGSAAINPDQAQQLATLGRVIADSVRQNPREMFLIEGHTDAVGSAASNLALSDRRAESVALALTEFFKVPPENMVVQGYGEQFLKVATDAPERINRRAAVRRITDLLNRG